MRLDTCVSHGSFHYLIVVAGEVILAVCGVGVDRMGLEEVLWSYDISTWTAESINSMEN